MQNNVAATSSPQQETSIRLYPNATKSMASRLRMSQLHRKIFMSLWLSTWVMEQKYDPHTGKLTVQSLSQIQKKAAQ
ncbi:hypothetical protein B1L08_06235 [Aeromonas veronii]|nr:hypothetical protein [Aeromonas veronii]